MEAELVIYEKAEILKINKVNNTIYLFIYQEYTSYINILNI